MKINAVSSFMKPVRNVVAAATVAAAPLAAKADTSALAKTNTINMASRNDYIAMAGTTIRLPKVDIDTITNNLPTKVEITKFIPNGSSAGRLEAVANGHVPAADILAKDKLGDAKWYVFDSLRYQGDYEAGTATKFGVNIPASAAESKFFRVVVPGMDANGQPVMGVTNNWGIILIKDADGKVLLSGRK